MNHHTIRARTIAQRDYLAFIEKNTSGDLAGWTRNMQSRGLAVNTIRQRVSLVRHWLGTQEFVSLPPRTSVCEAKWLSLEQVRAMLAVIPNNENGRRDFALITAILLTGLRLGQVRNWRWSDLDQGSRTVSADKGYLLKLVIEAVKAIGPSRTVAHSNNMHLSAAGKDEGYIFTAVHRRQCMALRQSSLSHRDKKNQPLSPQEINRRIKRYARLAGLEPQGISAQSLRQTHKKLGKITITTLVQDLLINRNTSPVRWKRVERDNRLHGIGRRGHRR